MAISRHLRSMVAERAQFRCEYCGLSPVGQEAAFHVDHVRPIVGGGETVADNLALACVSCSLRKGPRQNALDPESGREAPLFNPRQDRWMDHFRWRGAEVLGISETGRATVSLLRMNRPLILAIREEESHRHRHPPPA